MTWKKKHDFKFVLLVKSRQKDGKRRQRQVKDWKIINFVLNLFLFIMYKTILRKTMQKNIIISEYYPHKNLYMNAHSNTIHNSQ